MTNKIIKRAAIEIVLPSAVLITLVASGKLVLSEKMYQLILGSNVFIYALSLVIFHAGKKHTPETFVFRFLTLTTVQMLAFLSIVTALIYTKQTRTSIFVDLFFFLTLLIFQTVGNLKNRSK